MNATELCFGIGEKAGVWICRKCGRFSVSGKAAEDCCLPIICECGAELPINGHLTRCNDCTRRKLAERNATRLAEAELVADYDGWICSEEVCGNQDGYFASFDDLIEYCEDN